MPTPSLIMIGVGLPTHQIQQNTKAEPLLIRLSLFLTAVGFSISQLSAAECLCRSQTAERKSRLANR